jgi:hypothetical protein
MFFKIHNPQSEMCFSKSAIRISTARGTDPQSPAVDVFFKIRNPQPNAPQFVIAYAIFPGEVALSAIGEFQIKEVANHEENGANADFPGYSGGGKRPGPIRIPDGAGQPTEDRIFPHRPG